MLKQLAGANANIIQDQSNIFEEALPTFAMNKPQFLLGSNIATTNGLTPDQAQGALVNPVEAYIDLLPPGEEPVVLTVTKDSQEEIECITNSGLQIISMSTKIASDLGLSYDPNIVLNMQSAKRTLD
ncbi:hypothetical protein C0989_002649 [Termitomyces sp. Mn162]|nr:hypothetical protein C0989_002649 [Termitomyces sp. Mn162]